jgi:type III secretory pathway component EscS
MLTNIQSNTAKYLLLIIILTLVTSATCFGILICHLQAVKQTVVLLNYTVPLRSHAPT